MMADKNVQKNLIEGYILIYNGGTDSVRIEYRTKALGNFKNVSRFEEAFNSVRIKRRLQAEGVDTSLVNYIQNSTTIEQLKIDEEGKVTEMDFLTTFFLSIVLILLLMMMVVYSGQMLVRSMIEEKSSRLIEMLVSSSTPDEILAGKIFGLGSLGMTQILIWSMIGIALVGSSVIPVNAFKNILPMLIYFICWNRFCSEY
jgi:ABC-2 type transport system permease protein